MSSAISRNSRERASFACAVAALVVLSAAAVAFVFAHGWTLYYGDAQAHLDNARKIVDSRTPGYDQLGTAWLPLPQVLMLPLVWNMHLWQTGLAGSVPAAICFVIAGSFLFLSARRVFQREGAAWAAVAVFALNPNLLYLQSIPMSESMFFAALLAVLYASICYAQTNSGGALTGLALATISASLTRYEGWFLIPFTALWVLLASRERRISRTAVFVAIASAGPLWWLAHNWMIYGNAMEWYNGAGSPQAIEGALTHPGKHDWKLAALYFRTAALRVTGVAAFVVAAAGMFGMFWRRAWWPALLLLLPPAFYVMSVHSGGVPIFVPELYGSWYNTRYGLAVLPLVAFCAGGIPALLPAKWGSVAATAIAMVVAAPWLANPRPENWICWKESEVNSVARRAWTTRAARVLERNYRGGGILASSGDVTGIFCRAGIPLRDTLNDGNFGAWQFAVESPARLINEEWAVDQAGDQVSRAMAKARGYRMIDRITVPGAPAIEIWRK